MYDNKTQIVYGVGVNISYISPEIAKDKFDKYVSDFKEKYETDKWDERYKYYKENLDSLSEHIANGLFTNYNISFTDSSDNEFQISLSRIILDNKRESNCKVPIKCNYWDETSF